MAKQYPRGFILALIAAGPVAAADPASPHDAVRAVVERHQDAFARKDLKALIADYADDAVVVFPGQVPSGKAQVEAAFASYFASVPTTANFDVVIDKVDGDLGITRWVANPGTPKAVEGRDVFVVRGGKIRFQATYGVHPVNPAPAAAAK